VRVFIALLLAMPLYYVTDFGWQYLLIMVLQLFAGMDVKLFGRG
jgi:hypothetical protein